MAGGVGADTPGRAHVRAPEARRARPSRGTMAYPWPNPLFAASTYLSGQILPNLE
ncbi:hypothetical protein SRO_2826 [Streptomyces rochei]|nr:hypothetical protein SRO_2826 [Streptomyces rochei]